MGTAIRAGAALLLLLATLGAAWPDKEDPSIESRLAQWLIGKGAKLSGFKIGQECPTCLRGVIATKNFKPNEVIMKIPFKATVRFKRQLSYPAEYARELLQRMHTEPGFNDTFALFWEAHPGEGEVFTPELYTDAQLAALQTPELEELVQRQREVTEQVWAGTYIDEPSGPVAGIHPDITLQQFKLWAALINSRSFGFYCDGDAAADMCTHLVPLLDLVNHDEAANAERTGDDRVVTLNAITHIKKGQEIRHNYFHNVIHRPDMSLFYFGFVADRDPPLLPAVDLPTFRRDDPYAETPLDDSIYNDPKGRYVTKEEHERLSERLAACASTLEEDEALLAGGTVAAWQDLVLLKYRIQRKKAIRAALAKIEAHLGIAPAAADSSEEAEEAKDEL